MLVALFHSTLFEVSYVTQRCKAYVALDCTLWSQPPSTVSSLLPLWYERTSRWHELINICFIDQPAQPVAIDREKNPRRDRKRKVRHQ